MSQNPNQHHNRLNPGAYSFVPGQIPMRHVQQQGGPQNNAGPPPPQGGMPPRQGPGAHYGGGQQQRGYYNPNQSQYPQYGQQYQGGGPGGPGAGYGQYGPPAGGYGGHYNQSRNFSPNERQAYVPPPQQSSQPLGPPKSSGLPSLPPPRTVAPISSDELAPQSSQGNTGGATSESSPAPAPTGKTISLNIGGQSSTPAAAPSPVPAPSTESRSDDAPVAKTVSLNIGGSSSTPKLTPAASSSDQSAKETGPASTAQSELSSIPESGTTEAGPSQVVSANKSFNFTSDKSKTTTDTVLNDTLAAADEETLQDLYGNEQVVDENVKSHMNIVFVGHVDAGKSTLGGQLLYLTDMVDKRTMERYEREAREAGRESWYLSWALDSTTQERAKGKTVEVGRAYFETTSRRYTVLDAPGHKTYVPSMISGAAQADVAILVISARKGEFETGFDKGGQTREHVMLVKTAGVSKVIIVINKMDDPTVEWAKERYDEIKDKLTPFIRAAGFNPKTDATFIPISAYTGVNIKDKATKAQVPWYSGPSLLELLDQMPLIDRKLNGPVMLPISEKYKDQGTVVVGKLESGRIKKGDSLIMMPNKVTVEVTGITTESEVEIETAYGGDNVRLRLKGIDDEDVSPGFVLSSRSKTVHAVRRFEAQLAILDSKNIICAGYTAVMHCHTLSEEANLAALLHYFDKKTGRKSKKPPQFAKKGQKIIAQITVEAPICVEKFSEYPQLGRFTLRDEGKTIAIGKVTKLLADDETAITNGVADIALGAPAVSA